MNNIFYGESRVRDSSENPFETKEQKIEANSPTRRGTPKQFEKLIMKNILLLLLLWPVAKQSINAHQNGFKYVSLEQLLNISAYE